MPILWSWMLAQGIHIHFAHRTFQWQSAAKGKAAVHCVIIGFGLDNLSNKVIFDYPNIREEAIKIVAKNINPYLIDAPDIIVDKRSKPICKIPLMINGNKPTDGGNLLLNEIEKHELIAKEPLAEKWIRPFSMGDEFINNIPRYCLWLESCSPQQLKAMNEVLKRVDAVKNMRLASTDKATQKAAHTPTLFQAIRQSQTNYLALPRVSSERRNYIPIGFLTPDHIAGDKLHTIPDATLYEFGMLSSLMHNAWMRTITGRLKSDYQYSASIVYNNYPWPINPSIKQKQAIETAAQAVLDARALFPDSSLADLYDPLTMPPELTKAHQQLDKAVDTAYSKRKLATEAERVAFLFELYQEYTST